MTTQDNSSAFSAPRSIIIGTAGHVDHGKTALVRALTGIDMDRLPEEKRRGITIDLGFASFEAQAEDGSTLRLSLIDVPGHTRFVRNMLAGAGGIDAALLTIAADEGVMPQTEEHLAICALLGLRRGIVTLTKADAVSEERLVEVKDSVKRFLDNTFLASAPLIAVSAHSGFGIAGLLREMVRMAANIPERNSDKVLRLPIDRAFVIKGFGTVVTGTLIGGSVRTGDELAVAPGDRLVRVRGIQVHGRPEQEARAGSRVALNLARVETSELKRGDTLIVPASIAAVDVLDVELSVLPGAVPLKHRTQVHFHAFASECVATVTLYDATSIEPGETKLARLRLSEPVALLPDDRFVLRHGTPITTIGGGRVLDAHPHMQARKAKTAGWLRALRTASFEEWILLRIARLGVNGISARELSRETGLTEAALGGLIRRWVGEDRVHAIGERRWLTQESFAAVQETILRQFRNRSGSSSAGVRRSELREQTDLDAEVFDEALRGLERERKLQVVNEFVIPFMPVSATDSDQSLLSTVAKEYEVAGISPPSPDELGMRLGIAPAEMRRLVTLLLRDGMLVRLNDDAMCMDSRALQALAGRVRTLRGQTLDVAAFKKLTGVSRKFAIPLLEYLDRERITVRQGSLRRIL